MSKHKKNKDQPKSAKHASSSALSPPVNLPTPAEQVAKLSHAATVNMTEMDIQFIKTLPPPNPDQPLKELIAKGYEAVALLEAQRQRARKEEEQAKDEAARAAEQRARLVRDQEMLQLQQAEVEKRLAVLEQRQKDLQVGEDALLRRQEELLLREADADAGFAQRNRLALEQLDQEARVLREEMSKHRCRIASERGEWEKELLARRTEAQEDAAQRLEEAATVAERNRVKVQGELDRKAEELNMREKTLQAEAARLRKETRAIAVERELLAEERQAADERASRLSVAKLEQRDAKIKALEQRLMAARDERDSLARQLAEREEAERQFGEQTPSEVLRRLRELSKERDDLKTQVGNRLGAGAMQRLEELERMRERWDVERMRMLGEISELKQDLNTRRIAVTELEGLRNHKAALEASNELLTRALQDEIRKVNDLVRGSEGVSPFPSCSRMDRESEYQATRPTTDEIRSLKDFAEYVRHRMAYDPKTGKTLYYSKEDVRSFIAGLAMSRLHLLQGISGTGKTSLPLAFARAIGAGHALVEVQAGWRDRQDLIGHFNTFERRFYESEFLQALYRAACPQYRDTPFVIVLDEMNLSHPEQYFADLLSAMEQEQHRQRLVLMTAALEPSPALLAEGGRVLQIPANVWFVGTANHDETTKDFADKTYDRAHVMELPRHRDEFKIKEVQPAAPVAVGALIRAFKKAVETHGVGSTTAYKFLDGHLGELLGRRFGVGWGNRLQRQMEDYVPVVIACGGSIGEATDHILSTKLLRKIRDRHANRPEDILALREQITADWQKLDTSNPPKKSLAILGEELHRLGHDEE